MFHDNSTCYYYNYDIATTCTSSTSERFIWRYEGESGFMERQLLGNYSTKMFNMYKNSKQRWSILTEIQHKAIKMKKDEMKKREKI
jgi:hypothetical protein